MEKFYLTKHCKPLITTLLFMMGMSSFKSNAAVTITTATGGTNICANTAASGSAPSFTMLGNIVVTEGLAGDFAFGADQLTISAPAGWEFSMTLTPTISTSGGADILSASVGVTSTTINVSVNVGSTTSLDQFVITGVHIQPTSASAASGNLAASAVIGMAGISVGTLFGALSVTPALTPTVSIAASPAGVICAGTNVTFTPTATDAGTPTFQWLLNSAVVSIAPTYSNNGLVSGDQVSVVMTPTGCVTTTSVTSNMITMTVNPLPAAHNVTGGGNFCPGGTGVDVSLDGSDLGIDYQLLIGGVATGTPISGTGGVLSFGLQTVVGTYDVLAINTTTSCADTMNGPVTVGNYTVPAVFNVTGGGAACEGSAGVDISLDSSEVGVNYQLYNGSTAVGSPFVGTGAPFSFGMQTVAGTYSVSATNATTGCMNNMAGSQLVTINPLPTVFNVAGGGAYCAGGTGVTIDLDSSETGVDYQLYNGSTPVGGPVAGTGSPFSFGSFTATGTYTVQATNATTLCVADMAGSTTVSINPLPVAYNVTGGGLECPGGAGFDVSIDMSDLGIRYQLYNGATVVGTPVDGTGAAISFGMQTVAGTYTVLATDTTTFCTNAMTGNAIVTIYPTPTVFNVTGGGAYCDGGTGVTVDLDSSEVSVDYYLYNGTTLVSIVNGTGSPITFGLQTAAGGYVVTALDLLHGCTSSMSGTATVSINPLPAVYNVNGGGAYCAGGVGAVVVMDNSEVGVNYQLYVGGVAVGSPVTGTGSTISFGPQTTAGTYTAVATNATTSCVSDMTGSAVVTITTTVSPAVSISSTATDTICAGTNITFTAVPVNGGLLPAYSWSVNGVTTGTGPTYSYVPANGDVVKTVLTSSEVCPSPDTAAAVQTMTVVPISLPTVSVNVSPNDTVCDSTFISMTATTTFGGPSALVTWLKNGVAVATGSSYAYWPTNGDVIFTTLNSDYRCRLTSLTFSIPRVISVVEPIIPTVGLSISPGVIIAHGESDTLRANVTDGGDNPTYQWYRNGTAVPGATNAMYVSNTFQHNDSISVRVHRDDACALVNFNSVILSVGVGVSDVIFANSDINVMPNPSTGTFSIKGSVAAINDPKIAVEITNMLGQVVYSKEVIAMKGIVNEEISLDNSIANGTYLLSMKSGADKKVVRLVVEH
jgi:hypothetical protein